MRIELGVQVGMQKAVDEFEIPDEQWKAMTPKEREAECNGYLEGHISNNVDAWWKPLDDGGEGRDG